MGSMVHDTLEKLYEDLQHQKVNTVDELIVFFDKHWDEEYDPEKIVIVKEHMAVENYIEMGRKFIRDYYKKYEPFDQSKTLGLETQDFLPLGDGNQYHVRIDRLSKANGEEGDYEVRDYKTNSRLPSQAKLDGDRQLALYSIWVKNRFPDAKKVRLIWHFLAFDEEMESVQSDKDLEAKKTGCA